MNFTDGPSTSATGMSATVSGSRAEATVISDPTNAAAAAMGDESYGEDDQLLVGMETAKGVMTVIYILVFLIGTPGNLFIIYKLIKARLWSSTVTQLTVSQRSRLYIFALACSDLLLLLTLPLTASYNYNGTWIFGPIICYVHLSTEIIAKLLSVVLLTGMSLERYFIVCTRLRTSFNSWVSCIPLFLGIVCCVAIPSVWQFVYIIHYRFTAEGYDYYVVCINNMSDSVFNAFAQYTFFAGFVVPFLIMAFCYIRLVSHVKHKFHNRKTQTKAREPRYMNEMRKSIWRVAIYHFICWAPFWAFTITPHYISRYLEVVERTYWYVYCRLFANCLPYINAAGNWILYAVLNYDVRKHIYTNTKKSKRGFYSLSTNF